MKLVEERTGIKPNKVSEIRKEIIDHGLMTYIKNKDALLIHWGRIESFATFDHPIFEQGKYMPIKFNTKKWRRIAIKDLPGYAKPHASPERVEQAWETDFFETLEEMSEWKYQGLFQPLSAMEKEAASHVISEREHLQKVDMRSIDFHFIPSRGVYNYIYADPVLSEKSKMDIATFETVEAF